LPATTVLDIVFVLLVTLASVIAVNPYHYGVGDNSITIPFARAYIDPRLYPGDFMIDQRRYYYTLLWETLGFITRQTGVGLPALFFGVYFAALFGTFFSLYWFAVAVFRRREIGLLSIALLLFTRPTLGGVATIETVMSTRQVAIPLLILSLAFFIRRRPLWSFVCLGAAYVIHPMTAHYALALIIVAELVESRGIRARTVLLGLILFVSIASPILIWKLTKSPPTLRLLSADPSWLEALHLRSSHHMFPSTWGTAVLGRALLIVALFGIAWWKRPEPSGPEHRIALSFAVTVVMLCLAGEVFSELHPVALALVLQPLRSFQFLEYLATTYIAACFFSSTVEARRVADVLLSLALVALSLVGTPHGLRPLVLVLAVGAILIAARRGVRGSRAGRGFSVALAGFVVAVAVGGALRDRALGHYAAFEIGDAQEPHWLEAEHWAFDATDRRDAFIVPPLGPGQFRVESDRAVYAEWEDGGLMNGNPAFGTEWLRRMRRLGFRKRQTFENDFESRTAQDVLAIASEMKAPGRHVFLMMPRSAARRPFPIRYRNAEYVIYQVS
jgi:hypothetical protein